MTLTIGSQAFKNEYELPTQYTCEGENISPPLEWLGIPTNTKSLALIVDDPDAPDPKHPKTTWVHWVLYNIPPTISGLKQGISQLPPNTKEGYNDWQNPGYGGACPPIGRHRYYFKLYALDDTLPDLNNPSKIKLEKEMKKHIIEIATLIGTYEKKNVENKFIIDFK